MQINDSAWVEENYGTYRVIVFDTWSDGLVEAWTVSLTEEDMEHELGKVSRREKDVLTQALLADYNSEHFDMGTPGYDDLAAMALNGQLVEAGEFTAARLA